MSFVESSLGRGNDYFSRLEVDDEESSEFTDRWNTGELLCLATAVQRSGDKNWVSVSRSIKPFGEPKRPSDWYTPKNCALQYSKLLKGVEDFKKKSLPRTERETSEELLVKNLTDKRLNELMWLNQQTKAIANSLKSQLEMVDAGEYDEHIDDLLKKIDEHERREEDDFKDWISKRESLNTSKKLNKCRVPLTKGKAPSRSLESKRKNSPNPDNIEESTVSSIGTDIIIKTEVDTDDEFTTTSKPIHIKTEPVTPPGISTLLDNKAPNSVLPPVAPTSPLLTSLLRNVSSTSPVSQAIQSVCSSPLKESDVSEAKFPVSISEVELSALGAKSRETSPKNSVPQSPRPAPASSPLLNSLLKNSPSTPCSLSSVQIPQSKEASATKTVSSPQSFFNPTSALATAAAQQLAVATATVPQSNSFFQPDLIESRKNSLQSTVNSACLSAPTLSKLLEMPPSTPGRLPPLPVLDSTVSSSTSAVVNTVVQSPQKSTTESQHNDLLVTASPNKKCTDKLVSDHSSSVESSPLKKVGVFLIADKKVTSVIPSESSKVTSLDPENLFNRPSLEVDDTSQENIDLLEEVYESLSQAYEKKEVKPAGIVDDNKHSNSCNLNEDSMRSNISVAKQTAMQNALGKEKSSEIVSDLDADKLESCTDINTDKNVASSISTDVNKSSSSSVMDSDSSRKNELEVGTASNVQNNVNESENKVLEAAEEERGMSGRKFYKSRVTSKKRTSTEEDVLEKGIDNSIARPLAKKIPKSGKSESEASSTSFKLEHSLSPTDKDEEYEKNQDLKLAKTNEIRPPVCKKPRLFEKALSKEKKDLSEDEAPLVKRPGRRAKKGRGKIPKSLPVKHEEPKDQYEFSESTEENSVGYQTANTLCYMPRLKDDIRFEDAKVKQISSQVSEDSISTQNVSSPSVEKKYFNTPLRSKQGKNTSSQISSRKNLFTSDEERMSDSLTSDEASNPLSGEDKLKKWKESSEKKSDAFKELDDNVKAIQRTSKANESPKKKSQQAKRNSFGVKTDASSKKVEKKSASLDMEELSACSRDSEDAAGVTAWPREDGETNEEKEQNTILPGDVEAEANDSHMSSSVTAESDKQMDDVEGYESLQGSITTEFSPLPSSEAKEEKDLSQFIKQDWYHGTSPKSSEPVSQSSEESEEYESDNWDNQSVSTNKSVSHSCGQQSRLKRKERESPQYKAWKKAISIVLREASCHKYANVFLQKVTNDVAPGYLSIVYRPMDLSLIKKNIDNGFVKTTSEFHRDMMLMFQNAIMYNSSDHDVHHMAIEMQRDVIQQIQAFLTTQTNDKDETVEPASSLRGARTAKSQKVYSNATKSREETDRE